MADLAGLVEEDRPDLKFIAFDPRCSAILLVGGDKTGRWEEFYAEAIPEADGLYEVYLDELREEGEI